CVAQSGYEEPLEGTWTGRIEVLPGEEMFTYLEVENSSQGEAELFGELVDRPGPSARGAPSNVARPPKPTAPYMKNPRARLHGRNGAGGGNPFRVTLDRRLTYFDERAKEPLDLLAPLDINERGLAYCDGGDVPADQIFVVERVDYWCFARGDSNGPGGFA